jgi:2-haloacid dehalogenase
VPDGSMAEALAFDLYGTLVDPIAISADLARALGLSDGGEVARQWRLKQLEYSFRLTVMDRYQDFRYVTERALAFALASAGLSLPSRQLSQLADRYDQLPPFPDAEPALRSLTDLGYQLAVLSNGAPSMIQNCLASSGLDAYFAQRISADEIRAFKPSALLYRHAAQRLARPVQQIRLVSSNAFDSAGASAAGLRTAWVNRSGGPFDTIGSPPEITVPSLSHLPAALSG